MAEQASWPPANASMPPTLEPPAGPRGRPRRRPALGLLVLVGIVFRFAEGFADDVALRFFGPIAGLIALLVVVVIPIVWRLADKRRTRLKGGTEWTTDDVIDQLAASGLGEPAFPEDGTLLGASLLVVNQHTKLIEIYTDYDVFGSSGERLGSIRQIGQSSGKHLARLFTAFDQFFTHHFEFRDDLGRPVLRMTRPAKFLRSKLHVWDGQDNFVGTIQQMNIFWKIRFELLAANGQVVGHLRSKNVRAWDFEVFDWHERVVATVVKSWEGWGRTAFSKADRYVVRIHEQLPDPLRQLTLAAALTADVALKQDQRGF